MKRGWDVKKKIRGIEIAGIEWGKKNRLLRCDTVEVIGHYNYEL